MDEKPTKINVGCGRSIIQGWHNLDSFALPGVDIVFDLESCSINQIPLEDESIDELLLSHLVEHIHNILPMMQELHRIAKPGAKMVIRVPYGSSDDAYEDPTHIRQYFLGSFGYFSQPYYWKADYGYRGDWAPRKIILFVKKKYAENLDLNKIMELLMIQRNMVNEMVIELEAIKPIRPHEKEFQVQPKIEISVEK